MDAKPDDLSPLLQGARREREKLIAFLRAGIAEADAVLAIPDLEATDPKAHAKAKMLREYLPKLIEAIEQGEHWK